MFEQSTVYKLIKNSGFPFIVRQNRQIYATQPSVIDPALIFRRVVIASILGYFVGKKLRHKQVLCFFSFGSLVLLWHVGIDLKLKSEGKYQQLYIPPLMYDHQQETVHIATTPTANPNQIGKAFRLKPELQDVEIMRIDKLVDSLPRNYFI